VSSIQGIAESLGLQKSGGEFKGACPICGGDDRFHIRQGKNHELLVYCRHGCTYSQIMATLEKAGLVPKTDYIAPRYRYEDLDFADSIIMVGKGNLEQDFTFHPEDIVSIRDLISKVDPARAHKLGSLLRTVADKINRESNNGPDQSI
jgi:rhodanese-related sulfurtransferase